MRKSYNARVKLSKEHIDIEMRNIVRKMSHHSVLDIVEIIRQRMNVAADPAYIEKLLQEK